MSVKNPSDLFARFVHFVKKEHPTVNGLPTVKDLRLAIRKDRFTEIAVWSFKELDDVHVESLSYGDATVLGNIVPPQEETPALQTAASTM